MNYLIQSSFLIVICSNNERAAFVNFQICSNLSVGLFSKTGVPRGCCAKLTAYYCYCLCITLTPFSSFRENGRPWPWSGGQCHDLIWIGSLLWKQALTTRDVALFLAKQGEACSVCVWLPYLSVQNTGPGTSLFLAYVTRLPLFVSRTLFLIETPSVVYKLEY